MTFRQAEKLLLERQMFGIKLGLSNIKKALKKLGNPQKKYRTIHIAGTNGKGSTASIIESILRQNGYRTGLYTSPHIESVLERFRIDGENISGSEFARLYAALIPLMDDIPLTYFECTTAMAFRSFTENDVDIAVIETGLGGRFDATNVLRPDCSVITSIGYDHQVHLGDSLTGITKEKCGIIKNKIPVVSGVEQPLCVNIIRETAARNNSPLFLSNETSPVRNVRQTEYGNVFDAQFNDRIQSDLEIPLVGSYQLRNVSTAFTTLSVLNKNGIKVSQSGIRKGLQTVQWAERMQRVRKNPPFFIDVAHNEAGFRALAGEIGQLFPERKVVLLAGISTEKDWQSALRPILPICDYVAGLPVQRYEKKLAAQFNNFLNSNLTQGKLFTSIRKGIEHGERKSSRNNPMFYAGSHYIVAEVKKIINSLDRV